MTLTAKNKFVFVDGSLLRPNSDDLLFGAWIRCNSMVISWILNDVSRDIADSLLFITTASEIWTDLRNRFHESNAPRIFQIKKLLNGLQQGSMDANSYYTKLRILWDELKDFQPVSVCNCGSIKEWMTYQDQECVMLFLMGLNDSYAQIRAQILMTEPTPTISMLFSLVLQEERQRSIHKNMLDNGVDLSSVAAQSSHIAVVRSFQNNRGGRNGYPNDKNFGDRPLCSGCHYPGHTVDKCFKIHGYPPGHPRYK
ncbi:uncharacterized protein [Henckelia pumila]|uniref:uncharacterized protein n=1 Tax=Henckelia pumila TaxID=405737 RepID=UPI003C6E4FFA